MNLRLTYRAVGEWLWTEVDKLLCPAMFYFFNYYLFIFYFSGIKFASGVVDFGGLFPIVSRPQIQQFSDRGKLGCCRSGAN